jgi:hypothetical protein
MHTISLLCNSRARPSFRNRRGVQCAGILINNRPRAAVIRDMVGNKQRTILFAYQINELFERPALFMASP